MISTDIKADLERGSTIRKMFEEGTRLKTLYGADRVFDFSIGNPDVPTPAAIQDRLLEVAQESEHCGHGYMNNAGYASCRQAVADRETRKSGVEIRPEGVVMTVGAAGALNVIFKALLNPGEEVIVPSPYFGEYRFYVKNAGGRLVEVPAARPSFQLDVPALLAAVTPRTKAILLNNPNNPTGQVYTPTSLQALHAGLQTLGRPIYVVFDEPYAELVFEESVLAPLGLFENGIVAYSWSKSLSLPGERIGYIACSPACADYEDLCKALVHCNRTLGFVNAPALWQRVLTGACDLTVDVNIYRRRRDRMCAVLDRCGFTYARPQGTFYVFPQSPEPDDAAFAAACAEHNLLVVPGRNFGAPGYFRISFCVDENIISRSEKAFRAVAQQYGRI